MMLILCGLPCAGKTTIGKKCAQALSLPFIDTDHLIQTEEESVSEIWNRVGEKRFREMEAEVIASLVPNSAILATGGGTLVYETSRKKLAALGRLLYLKTSIPTLFQRIQQRGFPRFIDKEKPYLHLQQLAKERSYETYCDKILDTDSLTLKEIVEAVCFHYGR